MDSGKNKQADRLLRAGDGRGEPKLTAAHGRRPVRGCWGGTLLLEAARGTNPTCPMWVPRSSSHDPKPPGSKQRKVPGQPRTWPVPKTLSQGGVSSRQVFPGCPPNAGGCVGAPHLHCICLRWVPGLSPKFLMRCDMNLF